ncbi:hypothetical protein F5884DRAFT_382957 [Xylogone sp. PMI_703]|nr:hypothetical protein F5884DRAFT_382957 [Xylogone sp. PMI_703]
MVTQYDFEVPFAAARKQQPLKLLELPPELLTLLESEDPPTLTIRSSEASAGSPAYAILSSGDKNYQIRQKSTSNPIMVLQPSQTVPTDHDDPTKFIPKTSMAAIATVEDTLELALVASEESPAAPKKVNIWHERFAKGRTKPKPKD